jgi:hypothetical protein
MPKADSDKYPHAVLPTAPASHPDDHIMSAREAALWLDVNPRTAQLHSVVHVVDDSTHRCSGRLL